MTIEEIERRFYELKGKLDVGAITEAEFRAEIGKLRFQDAENRWWMIGAQSGKWYTYDGARWVPRQPPRDAAVTPPPPEPTRATPGEAAESVTLAIRRSDLARQLAETAGQPRPAVPSFRPRVRRAPIPVFAIIGCATIAVMILVLAVWIAVDNLVPGKPISSLISGSTRGGTPTVAPRGTPPTASKVAPDGNVVALLAAGDQLVLQSQMEAALAQYQSAASIAPTSPAPLTRWSRVLAFKGQIQDAVAKARQAVQRGPNDADAHAALCRALAWSGQTNEAIAAGEKALQLDPKNANARASLAEAYLWARRSADAQAQTQAALQLAPQSAEAHRAQAWVLTLAGQKDAALAEWQQTVALEPDLFFRHLELGEVLRVFFRMPTEAAAAYRQSLSLYGASIPAISRLGLAYLDLNQPQHAVAQFQRAITLDPNNTDGYAYLGIAFARTNQCPQAIPYFEYALRMDANHSIARRGLDDCKAGKTPGVPAPAVPNVPLAPPTLVPSSSAPPASTPSTKPYPGSRIILTVYAVSAKQFALFGASAADGGGRTKISEDASKAFGGRAADQARWEQRIGWLK